MSTQMYPRTLHLPWSPARTSDDLVHENCDALAGEEVVVLEKIDGENTGMCSSAVFTRSGEFRRWEGRNRMHVLHAGIAADIPPHTQVCGENAYAVHTIVYDRLPAHFLVFGIFDRREERVLSWDETCEWAELLGLSTVPVLWRGLWDEGFVRKGSFWVPRCGSESEGYVVRPVRPFPLADFSRLVGKYRARNTETPADYLRCPVVPNRLAAEHE